MFKKKLIVIGNCHMSRQFNYNQLFLVFIKFLLVFQKMTWMIPNQVEWMTSPKMQKWLCQSCKWRRSQDAMMMSAKFARMSLHKSLQKVQDGKFPLYSWCFGWSIRIKDVNVVGWVWGVKTLSWYYTWISFYFYNKKCP